MESYKKNQKKIKNNSNFKKLINQISDFRISFNKEEYIYLGNDKHTVKDMYNAEGSNRIGTTLVNLLNRVLLIKNELKNFELISENDILTEIDNIIVQIKSILTKIGVWNNTNEENSNKTLYYMNELFFGLDNVEDKIAFYNEFTNACENIEKYCESPSNIYMHIIYNELLYLKNANYDISSTELKQIISTLKEILLIEHKYCDEIDIFCLAENVVCQNTVSNEIILYEILRKKIYSFENLLTAEVKSVVLANLIKQEFKKIYTDLHQSIIEHYKIIDFQKKYENDLSCTYYINMYLYCKSRRGQKHYSNIKSDDLLKIFLKSILKDINYILANAMNEDKSLTFVEDKKRQQVIRLYGNNEIEHILEFKNIPYIKENDTYIYSIHSFKELFFTSRMYILKGTNRIRICKKCSKYFLTRNKSDEEYCHRKDKSGKICKPYQVQNENEIWKAQYKKICDMLQKRDKRNRENYSNKQFHELDDFKTEFNEIKKDFKNDEQKILEWLKNKHSTLKNKK